MQVAYLGLMARDLDLDKGTKLRPNGVFDGILAVLADFLIRALYFGKSGLFPIIRWQRVQQLHLERAQLALVIRRNFLYCAEPRLERAAQLAGELGPDEDFFQSSLGSRAFHADTVALTLCLQQLIFAKEFSCPVSTLTKLACRLLRIHINCPKCVVV